MRSQSTRQDPKLIVTVRAKFDDEKADIKQFASRLGMSDFAPFFEASNATDKKTIFDKLRVKFNLPNATSAPKRAVVLNEYEAENEHLCTEIESEEAFYGVSRGVDRLERHIQWVYIPAVKDASGEEMEGSNTAFSRLLAHAVRSKVDFQSQLDSLRRETLNKYQGIINDKNDSLNELSKSLQTRLQSWGSPKAEVRLTWYQDPTKFRIDEPAAKVSTGEQGFIGSLARTGHGLQRSYIISLLEELSSLEEDKEATLVLGIEEPELYQHPPQAKHLAYVLQELSQKDAQVILATHSSYFISGKGFESVRLMRRDSTKAAYCSSIDFATLSTKEADITRKAVIKPTGIRALLDPLLQPHISEMLFAEKLVLVEGLEDLAIISAWIEIAGMMRQFRQSGISIISVNGKSNLLRPAIIAKELEIPTVMVFDADGDCDKKYKKDNQIDNSRNIAWSTQTGISDFPENPQISGNIVIWPDNIQSSIFKNVNPNVLADAKECARQKCGQAKGLSKNTVWLGELLIEAAEQKWDMSLLNDVCSHICSDNW